MSCGWRGSLWSRMRVSMLLILSVSAVRYQKRRMSVSAPTEESFSTHSSSDVPKLNLSAQIIFYCTSREALHPHLPHLPPTGESSVSYWLKLRYSRLCSALFLAHSYYYEILTYYLVSPGHPQCPALWKRLISGASNGCHPVTSCLGSFYPRAGLFGPSNEEGGPGLSLPKLSTCWRCAFCWYCSSLLS